MPALVELIKSIQQEGGKTVLMVEHHIDVVTGVAERIAVMHHGALLACDTPDRRDGEPDRAGGVRRGAARDAAVRPLTLWPSTTSTSTSASPTSSRACRSASPEGGVTALLGRNGVGKTTTLRAIVGLDPRARHGRRSPATS